MTFASAAARTTAIASPTEGMTSYLSDTDSVEVYNGSAWKNIHYDSGWTTLTPGTGWAAISGYTLQYRVKGEVCFYRGMAQWNSGLITSTITTFPSGVRPSVNTFMGTVIMTDTSCIATILVATTGVMSIPSASYYLNTPTATKAFPISGSFWIS
jgi:hypothetical protein